MTLELLLAFTLASVLIELTPGPNMAYLAVVSLAEGRRAGFATVTGIALGLSIIGLISAFGLSEIIARSPSAYQVLRWSGIAFLFYLAIDAWRTGDEESSDKTRTLSAHFRRGLITNILNPKAAVFFLTVIPSFLTENETHLGQNILLVGIYVAAATLIHAVIVAAAGTFAPYLTDPGTARTVRRVLAVLLGLVAVWFAFSTMQPV